MIRATLVVLSLAGSALAGTTAGDCDPCGSSSSYSETVSTDSDGVVSRLITSSGCPNHYSYCTGKPKNADVCGAVGSEGPGTEAVSQDYAVSIPANQVIATSTTDLTCTPGAIGYAMNGIPC
eukprot:3095412-Prymnesium_polylepis.1